MSKEKNNIVEVEDDCPQIVIKQGVLGFQIIPTNVTDQVAVIVMLQTALMAMQQEMAKQSQIMMPGGNRFQN